MKRIIIGLIGSIFLVSCFDTKPPLSPLSKHELANLKSLQTEFEKKRKQIEQYKAEKNRVEQLRDSYLKENLILNNFSIYKTNQFDDGRERACYKGYLVNMGDEIVEELYIDITFFAKNSGEELSTFSKSLVNANDIYLDTTPASETKALILSVSGRKLPLKPNNKLDLSEGKNCLADVFLDWEAKDAKYEISNLRLRPKLSQVSSLELIRLSSNIAELKERAVEFNQL